MVSAARFGLVTAWKKYGRPDLFAAPDSSSGA